MEKVKFKVRVREHFNDIMRAATSTDDDLLKPIPKHFKWYHTSDPSLLRKKGINKVHQDGRAGNWKKRLELIEMFYEAIITKFPMQLKVGWDIVCIDGGWSLIIFEV